MKVPAKFGSLPQSFCQNLNSVQDQNQNQDHNFTLDFNIKITFYTYKTCTQFCLGALDASNVIVHPDKFWGRPNVRPYRQRDGNFFCSFCVLLQYMNIHQKEKLFSVNHAITMLSLFTYSVYDEKVKNELNWYLLVNQFQLDFRIYKHWTNVRPNKYDPYLFRSNTTNLNTRSGQLLSTPSDKKKLGPTKDDIAEYLKYYHIYS